MFTVVLKDTVGGSFIYIVNATTLTNRAETGLQLFVDGVRKYGLPNRVRGDRGDENVGVANFMLEHPLRGVG